MLKWIIIAVVAALFIGASYYILTHGGALEMQPEHAVEAPAKAPGTEAPAKAPAAEAPAKTPAKAPAAENRK